MARQTFERLFEQSRLTRKELAARSRLSLPRVDAIISGRWLPSPEQRECLSQALGVKVDDVDWGHTMSPRNVRYHRFGLPDDKFTSEQ